MLQLPERLPVTVIIPTYNRARLVCAAVESALAQTALPERIIVIDDGSTDETATALAPYLDRIDYHRQVNRGVSAARNIALSMATTEFIAFLDSDDLWHPRKLEMEVAVLRALPQVSLMFTEFNILRDDGTTLPNGSRRWLSDKDGFGSFYDHTILAGTLNVGHAGVPAETPVHYGQIYGPMLYKNLGLTSTALFRRAVLGDGIRFTEGVSLYEDWEFYARIARKNTVGFLDIETTSNRSHGDSVRLTRGSRISKVQAYLGVIQRVWQADREFAAANGPALRSIESATLLALAREAALIGERSIVIDALRRWKSLGTHAGQMSAAMYNVSSAIPGGGLALRLMLKLRTLLRVITGNQPHHYSSTPVG